MSINEVTMFTRITSIKINLMKGTCALFLCIFVLVESQVIICRNSNQNAKKVKRLTDVLPKLLTVLNQNFW